MFSSAGRIKLLTQNCKADYFAQRCVKCAPRYRYQSFFDSDMKCEYYFHDNSLVNVGWSLWESYARWRKAHSTLASLAGENIFVASTGLPLSGNKKIETTLSVCAGATTYPKATYRWLCSCKSKLIADSDNACFTKRLSRRISESITLLIRQPIL